MSLMNVKGSSVTVVIGAVLTAGSLLFAGPASAHSGHAAAGGTVSAGPARTVTAPGPSGPHAESTGTQVGSELPIASVGTAGSGRVPMTPLTPPAPSVATLGTGELPIAPVGTTR
ncbi:hypothetical protein B1R94_16980 [Mycolicibacterium litorale]|nr:hypothetical protein B1R94_16980 [Mycolicibacterium litorale]